MNPEQFIEKWAKSGGAELANSQLFLVELCTLLDVPQPDPTQSDESLNRYTFEKAISFNNGDGTFSAGRIDLYRQNCFVLESKQGIERKDIEQAEQLATVTKAKKYRSGTATRGTTAWSVAMQRARQQAKDYAEALAEWPPFLIVADVGHCFDIYADFAQSGKNYSPFPDPKSYRVYVSDLTNERQREKLRSIWIDPQSLDPSRRAAKVTRDVAERLGKLAKSLEAKHTPDVVAGFLMRCLFTMFSEDIGLLPSCSFSGLLKTFQTDIESFVPMVESLWDSMNHGKFSPILRKQLLLFNGGFFEDHTALPVTIDQLEMLIEAAAADWTEVEPAIFGTLIMRALDPRERRKLGAHFTPREYVERLVMPTIIEPLRKEWESVYAAAVQLEGEGKRSEGLKLLREFHGHLCEIKILDPACGTANFLYVALELVKRLEGEVMLAMQQFGDTQLPGFGVDPQQFLGIEVDPRAAAIAELVLWIGFLQWHFRTRQNVNPPIPVLKSYHNIECRDAVLDWDAVEPVVDAAGNPVTRWDGFTTKPHPVTGQEVPDENARVQAICYINPRKAEWPKATYVVGNPPFIGNKKMRTALGSGYVEAVRIAYPSLPASIDFVMYWWAIAAEKTAMKLIEASGLVTTNSIVQSFNRAIVQKYVDCKTSPVRLDFAIADHPWVESQDGANVRISMTTLRSGVGFGKLIKSITDEDNVPKPILGAIGSDLTVGANVTSTVRLKSNSGMTFQGIIPVGDGFRLNESQLTSLGFSPINLPREINPYIIGRDLTQSPSKRWIIDFSGMSEEEARNRQPSLYQWIYDRVRPERLQKPDKKQRERWWEFTRTRDELRAAVRGLKRFIVLRYTAKHRPYTFVENPTLPDAMVYTVASDDAAVLGYLSSRAHRVWELSVGGKLEDRPRYNNTVCFEPFPFPFSNPDIVGRIRDVAERLDECRTRQLVMHSTLTMTGMYNVLEKLRSGESLTAKEKVIYEQGLVTVLKQIHDDLDAAVFDAYGWPHNLSDEEILERLVDLNHERAKEEKRGLVRWLRPEYQNPQGQQQQQIDLTGPDDDEGTTKGGRGKPKPIPKAEKRDWPKTLPERVGRVREVLAGIGGPATVDIVAAHFTRAPKAAVGELLDTLVAVGQARQVDDTRYAV